MYTTRGEVGFPSKSHNFIFNEMAESYRCGAYGWVTTMGTPFFVKHGGVQGRRVPFCVRVCVCVTLMLLEGTF